LQLSRFSSAISARNADRPRLFGRNDKVVGVLNDARGA
jgi:hypothetical protein